jgi:hypothetical protein
MKQLGKKQDAAGFPASFCSALAVASSAFACNSKIQRLTTITFCHEISYSSVSDETFQNTVENTKLAGHQHV